MDNKNKETREATVSMSATDLVDDSDFEVNNIDTADTADLNRRFLDIMSQTLDCEVAGNDIYVLDNMIEMANPNNPREDVLLDRGILQIITVEYPVFLLSFPELPARAAAIHEIGNKPREWFTEGSGEAPEEYLLSEFPEVMDNYYGYHYTFPEGDDSSLKNMFDLLVSLCRLNEPSPEEPLAEDADADDDNFEVALLPTDDIVELYDIFRQQGRFLFDNDNISQLREAGLLDAGTGLPIWEREDGDRTPMGFQELATEFDFDIYDSDYLAELFKRALHDEIADGSQRVTIYVDHLAQVHRNEISADFLTHCLANDLWGWFREDDLSFEENKCFAELIDDTNRKRLAELGVPDIAKLDDDGADWKEPIIDAYQRACTQGRASGAENECLADLSIALEDAMPPGCEYVGYEENMDEICIGVSNKFIDDSLDDIWNAMRWGYADYLFDAIGQCVEDYVVQNFDFREPPYGWSGFDEEQFNYELEWRLSEIEPTGRKQ